MQKLSLKVLLANPRGFCAGVERAIEIVERALKKYGAPVYVRHEIVHSRYVVDDLKKKGAIFVDETNEIPERAITIFSAHGVSESVELAAHNLNLEVIDATCPLVKKVHKEAINHEKSGAQIILIGHRGHPEVEGTSGRVKNDVLLVQNIEDALSIEVKDPENLAYVTQTTLSVDDTKNIIEVLKSRFPSIKGPELKDICYATQNRQNAVKVLAAQSDVIIVIGSKSSSNSNRLRDLAEEMGVKSYLVDGASSIDDSWLDGIKTLGITAGASAPEILVEEVIEKLKTKYKVEVSSSEGVEENVKFKIPKELENIL
jgi:4-hydroxy-3-methylbut-2-enyl diphosphate reductase